MGRRMVALVAVTGIVAVLAAACGRDDVGVRTQSSTADVTTADYLPGVSADVHLPAATGSAPVVVLVPGGAWQTADPAGLVPLAEHLAAAGMVAVPITHRAAEDDVVFPVPVQDVTCAVSFAAAQARAAGIRPDPLVVLGHSSGAQLAALAALAPDEFRGDCPHPAVAADAFAGLAGAYDLVALSMVAVDLFGVPYDDAPGLWRRGDVATWVTARPGLPVFLAHGAADDLVPPSITATFAAALEAAGHPTSRQVVAGADHLTIFTVPVIGADLVDWVAGLRRGSAKPLVR